VSNPGNRKARKKPLKILLIEDSPTDARVISRGLQEVTEFVFDMAHVTTLNSGIEIVTSDHVDAIILDLVLPDSQGLASYHQIRERAKQHVPIVIITGSDNRDLVSAALQLGADNYLVKGTVDGNRIAIAILSAIRNRSIKFEAGLAQSLEAGLAQSEE
jgi:DNA-binding response OmpR family regulator